MMLALVSCGGNGGTPSGSGGNGDGILDAAFGFAGLPIGGQLNLAATKDIVVLDYTQEEIDKILSGNAAYIQTTIPAGTYGDFQDYETQTFDVKCLVIVNADMDENLIYDMCKAMNEAAARTLAEGKGGVYIKVAAIVAFCMTSFHIFTGIRGLYDFVTQRGIHLCFALTLVLLSQPLYKHVFKDKFAGSKPFRAVCRCIDIALIALSWVAWWMAQDEVHHLTERMSQTTWLMWKLNIVERFIFTAAGMLMFVPGSLTDIAGVVIAAAMLVINIKKWRGSKAAA